MQVSVNILMPVGAKPHLSYPVVRWVGTSGLNMFHGALLALSIQSFFVPGRRDRESFGGERQGQG